jgi:hypothetical protein
MSGFVPFVFTQVQLLQIRDLCGFEARGSGTVVFPAPWVQVQYLALEWRLQNLSQEEGEYVLSQYVTPLLALQQAIPTAGATLNIGVAGPYVRNANEMKERKALYTTWRKQLCAFLGILPGLGVDVLTTATRCVV